MAVQPVKVDLIAGISSMAMRQALTELGDTYETQCGKRVSVVSVGGVDAARRVQNGEAIDKLAAGGHVDPGSRTDLARSGVAIAVRGGAPRPDIGSESAVRDAVLHARTIGYSTGPSGAHLVRLFERWGIADAIAPRIVQASPGFLVGTLVARGDAELGFQQLSELMHLPGIDVIGLLPAEIQVETVFSAAVCTASNCLAAAKAWLSFLASPEADAAKRRHGMEPA
jgi:molybdate transport system substrate-binding protein